MALPGVRFRSICLSVVLLTLLLPRVQLSAQTVTGRITVDAGAPLPGAFVRLLNASGVPVAATLSNDSGGFNLRAPGPGEYSLRSEMIGYASHDVPAIRLSPGEAVTTTVVMALQAIPLAGVEVTTRSRRCVLDPEVGEATHILWEEARKALAVAAWGEEAGHYSFGVEVFTRHVDPNLAALGEVETSVRTVSGSSPFAALPADQLATHGFVHDIDGETYFFAPDARILLSDEFREGHCFRVEPALPGQPGLVGLAFSPARGSRLPAIDGVLWIDRATSEIRWLDYSYRNLPGRYRVGGNRLGGRVDFERLGTGLWIVRDWWIRMPQIELVDGVDLRLAGYMERGGTVLAVDEVRRIRADNAVAGAIAGTVIDRVTGAPLAGALVYLSGTSHSAATNADGRFRLDGLSPGEYGISYLHPDADPGAEYPPVQAIEVRAGEVSEVRLGQSRLQ